VRTVPDRLVAIGGLAALVVVLAGATHAAPLPLPTIPARTVYAVQPDPRLCPSPLCGGYWVARANHARTRCHDGFLRPRCYVAIALDTVTREPLARGLPANALVRAVIGSWTFEGFGELGAVFVSDLWEPVDSTRPSGDFFRLRDTGVRCIRAPCFWVRGWRVNRPGRITVSELDFGPAGSSPATLRRARAALATPDGLLTSGRVVRGTDGGRLFRASQVFLRAAMPRA
jgi:hypothetical protein